MKVTQRTIANRLGISVNAVSLALRNHHSVSTATRKRVHQTAAALGYRPNPLVSALMASRQGKVISDATTVAYITFCHHLRAKANTVRKRFHSGAAERASALGFKLEEFCLAKTDLHEARLEQILKTRGIPAVLLAPPPDDRTSLHLDWSQFVVAGLGHNLVFPRVHRVTHFQYQTFTNLLLTLKERNYQRPALVLEKQLDLNMKSQWSSVFEFESRHRWNLPDPLVHLYSGNRPQALLKWLRRLRPDVLLSSCRETRQLLERHGFGIPKEMGYVSLSYDPLPGEAHLKQNANLVGAAAVDLVTAHLYRNERGLPNHPKIVQLEGQLVDGKTLRPAGFGV
ncbi:MAG: LacI family DNA-binding transcriptional regulator [Verrucomicrobiota bacterium]